MALVRMSTHWDVPQLHNFLNSLRRTGQHAYGYGNDKLLVSISRRILLIYFNKSWESSQFDCFNPDMESCDDELIDEIILP